jgi:hypothetical protein
LSTAKTGFLDRQTDIAKRDHEQSPPKDMGKENAGADKAEKCRDYFNYRNGPYAPHLIERQAQLQRQKESIWRNLGDRITKRLPAAGYYSTRFRRS